MNTYERCINIRSAVLRVAAECIAYDSWGGDFVASQLRGLVTKFLERDPEYGNINPVDLTVNQLKDFGFGRWSSESNVWLIPLWLYPYLASDIKTTCIDGKEHHGFDAIDTDNRFGCLAYGVIPKVVN
jgi:hypothetical protein